jgi:protoheme ferro-lyase
MLKDFMLKALLARQLKNIPEEFQTRIIEAFSKDPEFLMTLAQEIKSRIDKGESQESAVQAVFFSNQERLKTLMGQSL